MTKVVAGAGGLDMDSGFAFLANFPDSSPSTTTSTKLVIDGPGGFVATVKGQNFQYSGPNTFPESGEMFSVKTTGGGLTPVSVTDFVLSVELFRTYMEGGPSGQAALMNDVFGGDDRIFGSRTDPNDLFGLGGGDLLVGGSKADTLEGDGGNDSLNGGRGSDDLFGEAGADTFIYKSTLDSRNLANADIIYGLDEANDIIDLRTIDAKVNKDGNQAFSIVAAFSGKAGEMTLTYDGFSYNTFVRMDVDGDANSDMVIILEGGPGFEDHSDFTNFFL
jgi:Ca2+-binding RTX toxin-like protein